MLHAIGMIKLGTKFEGFVKVENQSSPKLTKRLPSAATMVMPKIITIYFQLSIKNLFILYFI